MINHCTIYRKATGEIVQYSYFDCPDDVEQLARNYYGRLLFFGVDDYDFVEAESNSGTQYVTILDNQPVLADRPELVIFTENDKTTILADGEDSIVLTGLPDPCEIIIDDPDPDVETSVHTVLGGGFVFVADDPGVYSVEVRRWPFLPFLIELTAT